MVKLPVNIDKWLKVRDRGTKSKVVYLLLGISFAVVTGVHSLDFSRKIREEKIKEIRSEIAGIAKDERSKDEMLRIFGISNK